MITVLLIAFPLVAAVVVAFLKGHAARNAALGATLVELGLSIAALAQFQYNAETQFLVNVPWIPALGISFKAGMDGISLLMVLLTTVLMPFIVLAAFNRDYKNPGVFFALIMAMEAGLVGVFTAQDAFLFYIFWEVALVPIYFICLLWGGKDAPRITFKFFIYTLAGSLLMLVGLIYLYYQGAAPRTFDLQTLATLDLNATQQGFLFWAFFIAFAVKMPVWPFHTWQADTYQDSPAPGTMILAGLMSKMGVYAVLRILLPLAPQGLATYGPVVIVLAVIGIVYASLVALRQTDWKRLIAYSSVAHIGLIAAGIFTLREQAVAGSIIQMISHGINAVGLFFIVDILLLRTGTQDITRQGGIRLVAPGLAGLFLVMVLGNIALPLTNGFVGEFLLLSGLFEYSAWLAAIAGTGTILGAWYMLAAYQKSILGENSANANVLDLKLNEKLVLIPLVILVFAIGVYPKPLLDIAAPAVENLVNVIAK